MKLKVISFNIRCCDDKDGHSIPERAPRLDAVTKPYDADLIGLQEYRPAWEEYIERYYGEEYEIFNKYRSTENPESSPMLWKKDKFKCLKKGYFWYSDTPEIESKGWDERYDCHRICQYAVLKEKTTGKEFTFMNTHYGFGDKCHEDSSNLLYEYSKKISDLPTFITGDFNLNPQNHGYSVLTKYFTDVNAVTEKNTQDTYHGYQPEIFRDAHIDYCFINNKVTPVSHKVIDETVDGKFPSDHYGLFIELEI